MKKVILSLGFALSLYLPLNATLTSEQRFEIVKEKYPEAVKLENITDDTKTIYLEAASFDSKESNRDLLLDFLDKKTSFNDKYQKEIPVKVILDVAKGDKYVDENGTLKMETFYPLYIQDLVISNVEEDVTSIGDHFFDHHRMSTDIKKIDLTALRHVTSIGKSFLHRCDALKTLDLSPFQNVTNIGDRFLAQCTSLNVLDFSHLSKVQSIGSYFLALNGDIESFTFNMPELTKIGEYFLYKCGTYAMNSLGLKKLTFYAPKLEILEDHFANNCPHLQTLNLTMPNLKTINAGFCNNCEKLDVLNFDFQTLQTIKGSLLQEIRFAGFLSNSEFTELTLNAPQLKEIGNYCFSDIKNIRPQNIHFITPQLKKIGDHYMDKCKSSEKIDATIPETVKFIGNSFMAHFKGKIMTLNLPNVESIGTYFLSNAIDLESLTLQASQLKETSVFFLNECEKLTSLRMTAPHVESFCNLSSLESLRNIQNMSSMSTILHRAFISMLRESNNPEQQALGNSLYLQYLYKPTALELVLANWNFDTLMAITPKRLNDIEEMTSTDVLAIFDNIIMTLRKGFDDEVKSGFYDKFKNQKTEMIAEKEALFNNYALHFRPIVEFLYGAKVSITWAMYDEEKPHMAIVFKHIATKLQTLKIEDQATYMFDFLEALGNCQSRQSAVVNSITAKMGLLPFVSDRGRLNDLYNLINDFKLQQFNKAVGAIQANGETHHYMRYFTALDGKVGIPAALHMKEKISKLTDKEINQIWSEFFRLFFTPDILVEYVVKTIAEANDTEEKQIDPNNNRSYMNVRFELWEAEDQKVKDHYLKEGSYDIGAYFKDLNNDQSFDHFESTITKAEVKKLLELMLVIKPSQKESRLMEGV